MQRIHILQPLVDVCFSSTMFVENNEYNAEREEFFLNIIL